MRVSRRSVLALFAVLALGSAQARAAEPAAAHPKPPKQPPYAKEIAAFEAADAKAMPAPGGVLFVGSSSIRLWNTLAEDFPDLSVINRGFGGSQIADSTRYAGRIILPYRPKTV